VGQSTQKEPSVTANELFGEPTEDEAECDHPLFALLNKPQPSMLEQLLAALGVEGI
jgi:hypothetical protein